MLHALNKYGVIVGFPILVIAAIVRALSQHSIAAGLILLVWVFFGIIALVTILGLIAASMGRFRDLREAASSSGRSLAASVLLAWLFGLVLWIPPHSMTTHFLMVWAFVITGVLFLLPHYHAWAHMTQVLFIAALIFATGFINAAFHRH